MSYYFPQRNMGGVDLSDALIGYYKVLWKTKKLYHSLFYHFIDIVVVNAFILHQQMAASWNQKTKTQERFSGSRLVPWNEPGPSAPPALAPHITGGHPGHACHRSNYITTEFNTDCRRRWRVDHQKTAVICRAYDLHFCLQPARDYFNCWHDVHNL